MKSGFTKGETITVVVILFSIGLLANYHFNLAKAKARDFERKQNLQAISSAIEDYLADNGVFPPMTDDYRLTGCGDLNCPVNHSEGMPCNLEQGSAATNLACGQYIYMDPVPRAPINPKMKTKATYRYARPEPRRAILETCLELRSDIEAIDVSLSQTNLTTALCGSSVIFQITKN